MAAQHHPRGPILSTTLFSTLFPLICYYGYNLAVSLVERVRPSLSTIMNIQRRRWVTNATRRETPFDAILAGNLMGSVSFLASTAVLLILAVFAVFGQVPALMETLSSLSLERGYTMLDLQLHLVVMLAMFVLAFFAFTLSLRQFNHFCILIGASDHTVKTPAEEIRTIARINAMAAQSFNAGIRAYYFAIPMVAWFVSSWASILITALTIAFLIHREYYSNARWLIARITPH